MVVILGAVAIYLGIECLRWTFRPAARRMRMLTKLKSRPDDSLRDLHAEEHPGESKLN